MDLATLSERIDSVCGGDRAFHDLRELVAALAEQSDADSDRKAVAAAARFLQDYICRVPYLCQVARTAANAVGLRDPMDRVLTAVVSYFDDENDVVPDRLGAVGLLDDAYCCMASLQRVSTHYRLQTGKFLFPEDLTPANRAVRSVLGQPYAAELDRIVANTLDAADIESAIQNLATPDKRLHLRAGHTIWNHDSAATPGAGDLQALEALIGRG